MTRFSETSTRFDEYFYLASYNVVGSLAKLALGLKTIGEEHVADDGPGLIASNHRSWADIIALPLAVRKRHLSVLARHDLFEKPLQRFLFSHWEAIPIHRHGFTTDDYRRVKPVFEAGRLVGMFPEDTRGDRNMRRIDSRTNLGEFNEGVAGFAARFNAPTNPAAISGLDHILTKNHRRSARVIIGEAMEPPQRNSRSKEIFIAELRRRIEDLYDRSLEL